ncbi:MAG: hypothetical protein V8Q82_01650 [Christensenellales bacterium]
MSFSLIHANELTSLDLLIRIFVAVLIGCVVGTDASIKTVLPVCARTCWYALARA